MLGALLLILGAIVAIVAVLMGCARVLLGAWRSDLANQRSQLVGARRRSLVERRHEARMPVARRPFHALFPAAAVASLPPVGDISIAKLMGVVRSEVFAQWAAPRLRSLSLGLTGCALGAGLTALSVAAPRLAHFARPLAEVCGVAGAALFVPRLLLCLSEVASENLLAEGPLSEWGGPMGADATLVSAALLLFTAFWLGCRAEPQP